MHIKVVCGFLHIAQYGCGSEGVKQSSQPLNVEQYDAVAIAKGKMPAYVVLSTAELEERKVITV